MAPPTHTAPNPRIGYSQPRVLYRCCSALYPYLLCSIFSFQVCTSLPEPAHEEVQGVGEALLSVYKVAADIGAKQHAAKKAAAARNRSAADAATAAAVARIQAATAAAAAIAAEARGEDVVAPPAAAAPAVDPALPVPPEEDFISDEAAMLLLSKAAEGCPAAALPALTTRMNLGRILRSASQAKRQMDEMAALSALMARPLEAGATHRSRKLGQSFASPELPSW